jgi:integrase
VNLGPLVLKVIRQSMIDAGRSRNVINKDINRIRAMFRWAVENELVDVTVYQALRTVSSLRRGRSGARETAPVCPVPEESVNATLNHTPPTVTAMVRLQLLTGARPGEITALKPADVDRTDPTGWVYKPSGHKTAHHLRGRVIVFGPRAQEILRPWLDRAPDTPCFSPAEGEAARNAARRAARRSPMTPSKQFEDRMPYRHGGITAATTRIRTAASGRRVSCHLSWDHWFHR